MRALGPCGARRKKGKKDVAGQTPIGEVRRPIIRCSGRGYERSGEYFVRKMITSLVHSSRNLAMDLCGVLIRVDYSRA